MAERNSGSGRSRGGSSSGRSSGRPTSSNRSSSSRGGSSGGRSGGRPSAPRTGGRGEAPRTGTGGRGAGNTRGNGNTGRDGGTNDSTERRLAGGGRPGRPSTGGRSGSDRPRRDDERGGFRGRDDRGGAGRPRRDDDRGGFRGRDDRGGAGRPRRDDDRPSRPRRDDERGGFRGRDDRGGAGRPRRDDDRPSRPRRDDDRPSRPRRDDGRPARGGRPGADSRGRGRDDRSDSRGYRGERSERGSRFDRDTTRDSTVKRVNAQDPIIPDHITGQELERSVRNELRTLPDGLALRISRHLAASVEAANTDPELSWQHAQAALRKAARVGIVREAAAEAAYNAGHYEEAIREFRAALRMRGTKEYLPLIADCERALGRPRKAIEMASEPGVVNLERPARVEMRIVAAGARIDLGEYDAAIATLQCPELTASSPEPWAARIRYAYADALANAGRNEEAVEWFHRAAAVDVDELTDADERIAQLEGVTFLDEDIEYVYGDGSKMDFAGDEEEYGDEDDLESE